MNAKFRSTAGLEYLIKAGADVNAQNKKGLTPLHMAESASQVTVLIDAGANLNARDNKGNAPIHVHSETSILEKLYTAKADINAQNEIGETALYKSTAYYYPNIRKAKLLLSYGADWRIKTKSGHSPLSSASTEEVKKLLLDAGAEY